MPDLDAAVMPAGCLQIRAVGQREPCETIRKEYLAVLLEDPWRVSVVVWPEPEVVGVIVDRAKRIEAGPLQRIGVLVVLFDSGLELVEGDGIAGGQIDG